MNALSHYFKRETLLAFRHWSDSLQALLLHVLIISLFAFMMEGAPEARILAAPALIWFSIIVSTSLTADRFFRDDFYDGSLEQFVISGRPVLFLVLAKCAVYWLMTVLPVLLTLPVLGPLIGLEPATLLRFATGVLLGSPILVLLLALGAVVTLPLTHRGLLINCLIWPLILPVVLLSLGLLQSEVNVLVFLLALLCGSLSLFPLLIRYLLILSLE